MPEPIKQGYSKKQKSAPVNQFSPQRAPLSKTHKSVFAEAAPYFDPDDSSFEIPKHEDIYGHAGAIYRNQMPDDEITVTSPRHDASAFLSKRKRNSNNSISNSSFHQAADGELEPLVSQRSSFPAVASNASQNVQSVGSVFSTSPSFLPEKRRWSVYDTFILSAVAVIAVFTRFYALHQPSEVVFDEVHFGKFMAYYIRRTYYFDVHPPLGRLLFALVGWVAGFDGAFLFNNIGDSYLQNRIPYVLLRAWPAFCGAMVPPLAYRSMRNLGFSLQSSFLAALFITFDTALVTQSQMIMLDSCLILFVALSIFSWSKFSLIARVGPAFSYQWWKWLAMTGVSLGLVCGVKMVGLFTVFSVGICVLVDLWYHLDHRKTTLMKEFAKHFFARALMLIVLPISLYMLWFYIHFAVLNKTGPGDNFMSPGFQSSLIGNKNSGKSEYVHYGANVTIKHYDTNGYLHSHLDRYPLRYADGRVSSQGQQVTVYQHSDLNNMWQILPADRQQWPYYFSYKKDSTVETKFKPPRIYHNDTIVLFHVTTGSILYTHDVASPLMPTNQEFTTRLIWGPNAKPLSPEEIEMTKFRIDLGIKGNSKNTPESSALFTLGANLKLIHLKTGVAMYSHSGTLPEWGFSQQEVNGNKNPHHISNKWYVEEVKRKYTLNNSTDAPEKNEEVFPKPDYLDLKTENFRRPSFVEKFFELQRVMLQMNAKITKEHPYMSRPLDWPFVRRGISYWQKGPGKQIYLLPNVAGYAINLIAIVAYLGGLLGWALSSRRGHVVITSRHTRARVWSSCGYLFVVWASHYLPFFLMGRALFLHHYLPASVSGYMLSGAVFDIATSFLAHYLRGGSVKLAQGGSQDEASSKKAPLVGSGRKLMAKMLPTTLMALLVSADVFFFIKYSPLVYGNEELKPEEWSEMRKLKDWDFMYTKYTD